MADQPNDNSEGDVAIVLGLLSAVERNNAITQRSMAQDLGIALGLANSYLKRCIKKGLVKVSQAPANRYAYYLTPHGFAEKSRLTAQYLSMSFDFFRSARHQCETVFQQCAQANWNHVALAGTGDLGEIATLCVGEHTITILGFIDAAASTPTFAGLPVVATAADLSSLDAVVVTDMRAPQATFERMISQVPTNRVLAPKLLNITRQPPKDVT